MPLAIICSKIGVPQNNNSNYCNGPPTAFFWSRTDLFHCSSVRGEMSAKKKGIVAVGPLNSSEFGCFIRPQELYVRVIPAVDRNGQNEWNGGRSGGISGFFCIL